MGGFRVFIALSIAYVLHIQSAAAAYPTYLLGKSFAARYFQVDSMRQKLQDSDSSTIQNEFANLINWADDQDDDELKFALEIARLKCMALKAIRPDRTFEEGIAKVIGQLHKYKMANLEAEALAVYAQYCWIFSSKFTEAFEYTLDAYNIYSKISPKDFPPKREYTFGVGGCYFRFGDYRTASRYIHESLLLPEAPRCTHLHGMLNTLALCYRHLGIYDSAEYYFRQAYADVKDTANDIWAGIISGNLGITYYKEKKYGAAIPFLEKDIRMSLGHDDPNAANSIAILGDVYLNLGSKEKGLALLQQAYNIVVRANAWKEYQLRTTVYSLLSKAYAQTGNYQQAYNFSDSAVYARDSATKVLNGITLAGAQHKFELEKHRVEIEKTQREERINVFLRNTFLGGIGVAWLIAFLIINRQRLTAKLKHEQLEAEKEKAEIELKSSRIMLQDFTRNVVEKNELLERFNEELEQLRTLPGAEKITGTRSNVIPLYANTILSGEQWDQFKNLFEKANPGYIDRLRHKAPGLSPVEIRFIVLSKLQMSSREIASVLGISTDSVQLNRQKLKAKLNLPAETSLEKFSNTI